MFHLNLHGTMHGLKKSLTRLQVHACANVSLMYKRGEGVDKDDTKSDKYRRIALEKIAGANEPQVAFQEGLKPA